MQSSLQNKPPLSLYIHLPWCEVQCPYCDFSITTDPIKDNDLKLVDAIVQDIHSSSHLIDGRKFSSIYFGGGTPSLASVKSIERVLTAVKNDHLHKDIEVTFEMNPSDVTQEKLNALIAIGINRFSLGVQSFHDNELKALGRNHNRSTALEALSFFQGVNTTIDLMYGIEFQTLSSFKETIQKFLVSNHNHLSLYQLTIEPNTIYYKKELALPGELEIEAMEKVAKDLLAMNGYKQYEISSWSKEGFESEHNLNYWAFGDFLGVGPGAHSKITAGNEVSRFRKIKPLNGYIKKQRIVEHTIIKGDDLDMDLAMNLLRIKGGIKQGQISTLLPESFLKKYELGVAEGLLLKNKVGATKKGYQFLNQTIQLFF